MEFNKPNETKAVYVRALNVADLPHEIQKELGNLQTVYGIFDSEGTQLALVNGERLAYSVAREHDYQPQALN